jgi:hypothetical protein
VSPRTWLPLVSLLLASALSGNAIAFDEGPARFRAQIGLGATMGNNVLPAPFAPGLSGVIEWRHFGFEAGVQVNAATLCEDRDGIDRGCGLLLTAEMGPRLSLPITERWIPYVSTKAQWLRMTKADNNEIGVAFRLGLVYQRERFGAFVEAGETVLFGDNQDYPTIRANPHGSNGSSRLVPALAFGMRF